MNKLWGGKHTFVIAEAGINHNGDRETARKLIDVAVDAGADAVKFQKRTPLMQVKPAEWNDMRDTPWGPMTKRDYRERIELSGHDYIWLKKYADEYGILFTASPWDMNAADTLGTGLKVPFFKIASAHVTDLELIEHIAEMGLPVVMSTGMSQYREVFNAVQVLHRHDVTVALLACTSAYPCQVEDLHLERIRSLRGLFPDCTIGYSGHEPGLWTTLCAVAMGAQIVERHITLDRTMKGSDHASSLEPHGFKKLVHEIRQFEKARGSGEITVHPCEVEQIKRLRS